MLGKTIYCNQIISQIRKIIWIYIPYFRAIIEFYKNNEFATENVYNGSRICILKHLHWEKRGQGLREREREGHRERDEVRKAYGYDNIVCR